MRKDATVPGGISPHLIPYLIQIVAFAGVVGMYLLISINSPFTLLYLLLALVAGRLFFPLLGLLGVLVISAAFRIPSTLNEVFLCGQLIIVTVLLMCGRLVTPVAKTGIRTRVLARTGRWIRFIFVATALILVVRVALFRNALLLPGIAWSGTLLAFAWKGPWPARSSRISLKGGAVNFALALLSTVVSLAGAEVAARALFDPPPIKQPARAGFETHPEALWTLRPGRTDTYTTMPNKGAPREFEVTVSSQGLRERELGPKLPGEFRILVLGDSLTMGWGVSYEEAYPHLLEERLNARGLSRHITVMNGGVAGYGPWQERQFFLERGLPLQPDLVILQVYPENDVHNTLNKTGEYLEAYNQSWEQMVLYWRYHADWRMQAEWWLLTHCRLYSQLKIATNSNLDMTRLLRQCRFVNPVRIPQLPPNAPRPFYLEFMLDRWYPRLQQSWDMMTADIRGLRDDCATRNIGFFAFCLPSWTEVYDASWAEAVSKAGDQVSYERYKDVRLCESFFHLAGIHYANVTNTILDQSTGLYLNDGHLSPKGNRVLAQELCDALVDDVLPKYGVTTAR